MIDYKYCAKCGRLIPAEYSKDVCFICEEILLFSEVKDFIRDGKEINEFDVSEHFNIPIHRVKGWIRDGRIQYKPNSKTPAGMTVCSRCGRSIACGDLCMACQKDEDINKLLVKADATQRKMDAVHKIKRN